MELAGFTVGMSVLYRQPLRGNIRRWSVFEVLGFRV